MRKILTILLICIFSMTNLGFAINRNSKKSTNQHLLSSQVFPAPISTGIINNPNQSMTTPPSIIAHQHGAVKVDDSLMGASGVTNTTKRNFTNFQTFKYATLKVISFVPGIGPIISTGNEIFSALSAVSSDLKYIEPTKPVQEVSTSYSYRYFYHYLYVWNYNNSWKPVGHSLSKYYYKHFTMRYYNSVKQDYKLVSFNFTHSDGYAPIAIAKAPNYMNYKKLTELAYEA